MKTRSIGAVCVAVLLAAACAMETDQMFADSGRIVVSVRDQDGVAVEGVGVQVFTANSLTPLHQGRTGADGVFDTFLIPTGTYDVQIAPPAGYSVPPTHPNPVRITVPARQITVNFMATRS
jgi:hypothetical protein